MIAVSDYQKNDMKLGILGPQQFVDKVMLVNKKEKTKLISIPLIYKNYTETSAILKKAQMELDGVLFTEDASYILGKETTSAIIPWEVIPRLGDALMKAFWIAREEVTFDIKKISIDSYSKELLGEIGEEFGMSHAAVKVWQVPQCPVSTAYFSDLARFHEILFNQGEVTHCFTALNGVWHALLKKKIPATLVEPTSSTVRYFLTRMEEKLLLDKLMQKQVVVISIHLDPFSNYSLFNESSYNVALAKMHTGRQIFSLAEKLEAAVTEISFDEYVLYLNQDLLIKSSTDDIKKTLQSTLLKLDMGKTMNLGSLCNLSIGIGFGATARAAKENAEKAKAMAVYKGGNNIYVVGGPGELEGPFRLESGQKVSPNIKIDSRLWLLAQKCGLSTRTLQKLFLVTEETGKGEFTTTELGRYLLVSERTVNRMVEKLEAAGLCNIIGEVMLAKTGRPRRVIKFNLQN